MVGKIRRMRVCIISITFVPCNSQKKTIGSFCLVVFFIYIYSILSPSSFFQEMHMHRINVTQESCSRSRCACPLIYSCSFLPFPFPSDASIFHIVSIDIKKMHKINCVVGDSAVIFRNMDG